MLQDEYLLAKIGADTEENEPSNVWPHRWKIGEIFGTESFHYKYAKFDEKCWKFFFTEIWANIWKSLPILYGNFEFWAVQRCAKLVDLEKCFPMSIYLQRSVPIQKRTSPRKFDHFAEKSEKDSVPNLSTVPGGTRGVPGGTRGYQGLPGASKK